MSEKTLQERLSEAVRVALVLSSTQEVFKDEGVDDQSILDIASTLTNAHIRIEYLEARVKQLEEEPPTKPPFFIQKGDDGYWLIVELPEGSVQFNRGAYRLATDYFNETLDTVVKMTNPHNRASNPPKEATKL